MAAETQRIGGLLVTTPVLHAMHQRWPEARPVVVTGPKNRVVLKGLPFVEAGPLFRRDPSTWVMLGGWLRRQRFDLAVSLRAERMAGVFVAAASGAPVRATTHRTKTHPAFNLILGADDVHYVTRASRAAERLRVARLPRRPVYVVPAACEERADAIAAGVRGASDGRLVGVTVPHRGSRRHLRRTLSREWLVELVCGLAGEGCGVVLLAAASQRAEAESIRAAVPGIWVLSRLSLADVAGVLKRLDLVVSTFTGTLHLADAVGTPTVAMGDP